MQSPAHFLVGAAVCRHTKCKPLGLTLALASHFVLDAIPHFEDPSILPKRIAPVAGHYWHLVLAGAQVVMVCLAIGVWWRYRRATDAPAAYLIAGGLLACLPDYLQWIGGIDSLLSSLGRWSHRWWFVPYLRFVLEEPDKRPLVAAWCLALESLVCVAGGLALFGIASRDGGSAETAAGQGC
jgi:hypothetical protein